jgi:hypothetical protein
MPKATTKAKTLTIISSWVAPANAAMERADAEPRARERRGTLAPKVYEQVTEVSLDALKSSLDAATDSLSEIFSSAFERTFGDFELNEVEMALEVSADGRVGIMGTGAGVKGSGSIKLKFTRKKGAK